MTDQLDGPLVELVDESTGTKYTPEDVMRNMTDADLKSIAEEMKRRCNLLLLPVSLFYRGTEFRAFVDDFTAKNGVKPEFFSIGDQEMPVPAYWPEAGYWSMVEPRYWDNGGYQLPGEVQKNEEGEEIRTCRLCGKVM